MAAKKKTAKKKAAMKKPAAKKTSKKKTARKRAPAQNKKAAPKKKATSKKKSAAKKKSSPTRQVVKKKSPAKKSSPQTKPARKSRSAARTPIDVPDTIIVITEEVTEIRPRVSRDVPIAVEVVGALVDVRFELGIGRLTVLLFRSGEQIGEQELDQSGVISFPDVRARDVITLNGLCTGTAKVFTNRTTIPASDEAHPRRYAEQNILDTLLVR